MYITCQKCKANFVVSPEQIGSKGRRVRCSKCQHTWYVDPVIAPPAATVITPQVELLKPPSSGIHLPIVLPPEPHKPSSDRIILFVLFLIFSFAIFFSKSIDFDFADGFSNNFTISDVKVYHEGDNGKMILRYGITNDGDKLAPMPDIRIQLFDAEHKAIGAYDMKGGEAELEPHQHLKFRTEFADISKEARTADVTIGSRLNFIFK